jgi:tetratricopeptide (TPR) repeat protein
MPSPRPSSTEPSATAREAIRLLQAGKTVDAEETVLRAAEKTRAKFGAGSPQDAVAQSELGSVLLNLGQLDRAIAAYREAVTGPMPDDELGKRDRLTFLLNLGQTLLMAKRLEEAEEALHTGLEGREEFYGREHAGYAYGLEPLAEATYRLGKTAPALEMMEEVVRNFWKNGHRRVGGAVAIRAEMLKAAGNPAPPFTGLEKLPNEYIEELGKKAISRIARTEDLKISRAVLADLVPLLASRLGEAHAQTTAALIAVSNVERKLGEEGDPAIRQAAIQRLIAGFDAQARSSEALQAVLSLALAQSDAGQNQAAADTYKQALQRVQASSGPREKSEVLRNYGLLLAELKRDTEAEERLRQAVAEAENADNEVLARALIALGIFLQHCSRVDEGRPMLARALPMLEPTHPDALACRSHLQAAEAGGLCGCGDTNAALVEAFREFVMTRVPEGVLDKLDVSLKDGSFGVKIFLNRQPSPPELERLNRVMEHASNEFKEKIGRA